jgi:hypothetical protein
LVSPPAPPTPINRPGPAPTGTRIHIVDVASTADQIILDTNTKWATVGYTGKQVYLIHAQPEAAPDGGLFALDVSSAAIKELASPLASGSEASPIAWTVIGSDAAWGTDLDGRLARFDFLTKTASIWLTRPGRTRVIALDRKGMPIVTGDPFGASLVTAPQQEVKIADESTSIDDARGDAYGIWLLTGQNVYLWSPGATLKLVSSSVSRTGMSSSLAGPCR